MRTHPFVCECEAGDKWHTSTSEIGKVPTLVAYRSSIDFHFDSISPYVVSHYETKVFFFVCALCTDCKLEFMRVVPTKTKMLLKIRALAMTAREKKGDKITATY